MGSLTGKVAFQEGNGGAGDGDRNFKRPGCDLGRHEKCLQKWFKPLRIKARSYFLGN